MKKSKKHSSTMIIQFPEEKWLIIGWLASFKDFLKLDLSFNMSVVVGIIIAFISIGITKLLPRIRLAGRVNGDRRQ